MDSYFEKFNTKRDGLLTLSDFGNLCDDLFKNSQGEAKPLEPEKQKEIFDVFDKNKDGFIDKSEFEFCWNRWIKKIIRPVSALLIVDVQNDFISGSLSLLNCPSKQDASQIIPPINEMIDTVKFDKVFYSLDWHPDNHSSFHDNLHLRPLHSSSKLTTEQAKVYDTVVFDGEPPIEQTLWPRHCVQKSWGAELHSDLKVAPDSVFVYKGTNAEIDSYSAFFDNQRLNHTCLDEQMREHNITDVYICGIACDICVGATARDAINLGYRTILVEDCCAAIDENNAKSTVNSLEHLHGIIADAKQVKAMVEGKERQVEMGYKLCLQLKAELDKQGL